MAAKLLLTGATGFLGSRLAVALNAKPEVNLTIVTRRPTEISATKVLAVESIDGATVWSTALVDHRVVVHVAGSAHSTKNKATNSLAEHRRVNVEGTLNLARQAAAAGVERFVFISSIGVNGNFSTQPFTEDDASNPVESYAHSKWQAEQGLWEIQRKTGIELVIIRPPLIYGPNAPGNFGRLVRWVEKGVPLPFGAVQNQRSLVAQDNLVDLIVKCLDHPAAANQVFIAGDGQDISTTDLLRGVAIAMGKPSRLIPLPSSWLMIGATLIGKRALAQQLVGSLQVDISKARHLLGWEPPITVEEGLRRCFESYQD